MERGPSFEMPREPETPEQLFRSGLRGEMREMRLHAEAPFTREVAEKILGKLEIKDQIEQMSRYRNDPTIQQPWKQLGLFIAIDRTATVPWNDPNSDFEINEGDRVIDLHLPPVPAEQRTLKQVNASMHLLAEYIDMHGIDAKYVMGVTFERLAAVSKRQGFTVVEPEIPDDLKRGVERVYERFNSGPDAKPMGKILLCYQETSKFLEKFLT